MNRMHDRWYRPLRPAALAAVTALVVLLAAAGVLPRWSGLIHLVALPPLDLIADLRVLAAAAPSHPVFLAGLALSLAVRITVLAALLGGLDRRRLARAARYYLLVLPLALLAAAQLLGAGAILYAGLFWTGVTTAFVTTVLTAAAAWRPGRHTLRLGTVSAYLLLLTALGALADLAGPAAAPALVPASALLTLTTARLLTPSPSQVTPPSSPSDPPLPPSPEAASPQSQVSPPSSQVSPPSSEVAPPLSGIPPRPEGGASGVFSAFRLVRWVVAGVGVVLVAALVAVALTGPAGPPRAQRPQTPRPGSLMLMSGVDSSSGDGAVLEIDPHPLGYTCDQTYYFSYAGPGRGQPRRAALCPITTGAPYRNIDTMRPTEDLVGALEAQLAALPPPVVLVTHSQGVWITWTAALRHRLPNVGALVLVGPFPDNPVPYPPQGEPGAGLLAADVTRLISGTVRSYGVSVFTPDSPLGREWLGHPTAIPATLARRPPEGLRVLAAPGVFDTPLMPDGPALPWAANLCPIPVLHPNLPFSAEFQRSLVRFLDHDPQPPCPPWRHAVGHAFRPFSVPAGKYLSGYG